MVMIPATTISMMMSEAADRLAASQDELAKLRADNKAVLDALRDADKAFRELSEDDLSNDAVMILGDLAVKIRATLAEHSEPQ